MLRTTEGYWDPIVWIIAFIVITVVIYILRSFGRSDSSNKGDQGKPYLSGNPELNKDASHIRASNIYWGFIESMRGYYNIIMKIHNGIINDYVGWFVGITAIFFIVIFLVEVI